MEAITIVCDYGDGELAAEQITFSARGRRLVVDLCEGNLNELIEKARAPKRGRRPKEAPAAKRRGRPPGAKNKAKPANGRRKRRAKRGGRRRTKSGAAKG